MVEPRPGFPTFVAAPEDFGFFLRVLRKSQGLSTLQLAERAGIDASTISRLEMGKRSPSPGMVELLTQGLEADEADTARLFAAAGFMPEGWWLVRVQ